MFEFWWVSSQTNVLKPIPYYSSHQKHISYIDLITHQKSILLVLMVLYYIKQE